MMKLVWTFCVLKVIGSMAAPIAEEPPNLPDEDELRNRRSSFLIPSVAPCAASSLPMVPGYHNMPVQQYLRPQYYNYPRYRSIDPSEMYLNMDISRNAQNTGSMEGIPIASKPGYTIYNPQNYAQVMQNMPTVGIFPYVNPNPMNIPLLITCTPTVAQGQMVQPQHNSYRSDVFRNTDYEELFVQDNESQSENWTNQKDKVAVKPQ